MALVQQVHRRYVGDARERLPEVEAFLSSDDVAFRFVPAPRSGDIVIEARGLGASRGGRQLFSGVDLLMRRAVLSLSLSLCAACGAPARPAAKAEERAAASSCDEPPAASVAKPTRHEVSGRVAPK